MRMNGEHPVESCKGLAAQIAVLGAREVRLERQRMRYQPVNTIHV